MPASSYSAPAPGAAKTTAPSQGTSRHSPSVQYFATAPNNGVFGPAAKLVPLHARPTSATARPLSSRSASRSEDRPTSRIRHHTTTAPLPHATPQRTASTRSVFTPGQVKRPSGSSATPQATRTTSMPRVMRRPTSAAATHARPGSALRTPRRAPSGFAFEDSVPSTNDDADRRLDLLEQLHLQHTHDTPPKTRAADAAVPHSPSPRGAPPPDAPPADTPTIDALRTEIRTLQAAAATKDTELATLRAELDAARQQTERASPAAADDTKIPSMVAAWERERTELTSRIEELQGAGREAISVFEHQLDLAAREQQALRSQIQQLETQLSAKEQEDTSVSATDIEMTSLREQLAHLTTKHEGLEEELAESRDALEKARSEARQHSADKDTASTSFHEQLRAAQAEAQQHKDALAQAEKEVARLQEALRAEQAAREHEREDLDTMRAAPHDDDVHAKLAALEAAKKEQADAHAKEIAELESLVESRIFREDELESEMEQLRKERDEARAALEARQ